MADGQPTVDLVVYLQDLIESRTGSPYISGGPYHLGFTDGLRHVLKRLLPPEPKPDAQQQ